MEGGEKSNKELHISQSNGKAPQFPKVVTLSIPFPGAKRPFEEGAKLGLWDFVLLEGGRVQIPPADIYILAAWHPAYIPLLGLQGKIGVMWTSSVGEMDFTPVEQEYLRSILADPRISFIWFGDESLARLYPRKGFWAPYPLDVDGLGSPYQDPHKEDIATLFCPTGLKKNILNQLLAMKLVQRSRKLTLHTNLQSYDHILKDLDCVHHDWLPEAEYHKLIASAKVNLGVSWCETFNYQIAEAALVGTASVISPTILLPGIGIKNPNDPSEIASTILDCLSHGICDMRDKTVEFLTERNRQALKILKDKLSTQVPYE